MPLAFVIMPFRRSELSALYWTVVKPTVESVPGWRCLRADEHDQATYVIGKTIIQQIEIADIVIADLTTLNPNVFYELGVAHSFATNVLMLADALEGIPFDLHDYRVFQYHDTIDGRAALSSFLIDSLASLRWTTKNNNPVHHHSTRIKRLLDFRMKSAAMTNNAAVAAQLYDAARWSRPAAHPVTQHVIQICGGVAVGKTTFARALAQTIATAEGESNIATLSLDAYQLSRLERNSRPISHGFATENWRLADARSQLSDYLEHGTPFSVREFDHLTGLPGATETKILPAKYLIIEGLVAFRPELYAYGTFRIFIGGDDPRHEQNLRIKVAYHERDYSLRAAVQHSEGEFRAYIRELRPLRTLADVTIEVRDEWSYHARWPTDA